MNSLDHIMRTGRMSVNIIWVDTRGDFLVTIYNVKHHVSANGRGPTVDIATRRAIEELPRAPMIDEAAPVELMPVFPGKEMTR